VTGIPLRIAQFPHCDSRILHAPSECEYCDRHPEWQELREAWGIAFTGHPPRAGLPRCREPMTAYGRAARCEQPAGHEDDHLPYPAWDLMPCPADAARPQDASNDHRRWGGNKPTGADGDPSWPAETTASVVMYGDKGGRAQWPLPERIRRRVRRPFEDWKRRRRGWHKENGWWRFP
jgi:hypothetical protein